MSVTVSAKDLEEETKTGLARLTIGQEPSGNVRLLGVTSSVYGDKASLSVAQSSDISISFPAMDTSAARTNTFISV